MNKKIVSLTAAAVLALSAVLAGCSGGGDTADTGADNQDQTTKTITSEADLAGARIGVQLGTTGDILASDYEAEGATVERYTKGADAVQALTQGKIDCVVIDQQPAEAFVAVNDGLKILDQTFEPEEYAICISKDNTELKDQINGALAELKADGTIDSIIANYIGDDTKGQSPYESPADVSRDNGTLVVATNATFEPYEYMENGEVVGIDIDIAQAICDKLGMELQVDNIEFDAIITAVQSGRADIGIAGMTVTEDRLQSIDFTDTYATSTQVIIVPDNQ
ncbi:MAG TPA: transporter substrate-binding domain-containing protein [Candidatus Ornithomonoglobus merdipullorum]|uniref:Transporter substrate-binding domain-containing protein n=1 Tax=Candidatus Ornithomonoglobus merdipullorum TaxID=2840895 RepID=A0A9D1ME56_9FIRM|nr:transporter substrate-binding domain-containing protein [Candidatus Ornithomonoglobus merdipullorum]